MNKELWHELLELKNKFKEEYGYNELGHEHSRRVLAQFLVYLQDKEVS